MEATRRSALGAVLGLACGLAGCAEGARTQRLLPARSCTIRLAGPLSGEYRCEGAVFRQEEGWVVSATLPPGAKVAGSIQVPVPGAGTVPPGDDLPGGRAVLREPGHAGVGVVWGGVPRGRAHLVLGLDGSPASAELAVVVPPLRANPAEEPVLLVVQVGLAGPGYVAGNPSATLTR